MNLLDGSFDEWVGDLLEGAMFQSLMTTFIIAFVAIAAFGHVLLLQAIFAPKPPRPAQTDEQASPHAPVTAARIAA